LGTFWLKIEQFWPFEEVSIFSNGSHLGYKTSRTDKFLKGDELFNIYYRIFMSFELLPILTDYAN
jgi:hypothetical protein